MVGGTETKLPLSQSAALVVLLVRGAMPFARSGEDEFQRWLRALRLHGDAGRALQGLGVGEKPLVDGFASSLPHALRIPLGAQAVPIVLERARKCAAASGIDRVGTPELLVAVIQAYGDISTGALQASGTSTGELLERVAARRSAAG